MRMMTDVMWNEEERKSLVLRQHSYRSAVRDFGKSRSLRTFRLPIAVRLNTNPTRQCLRFVHCCMFRAEFSLSLPDIIPNFFFLSFFFFLNAIFCVVCLASLLLCKQH